MTVADQVTAYVKTASFVLGAIYNAIVAYEASTKFKIAASLATAGMFAFLAYREALQWPIW
jgi:hypothetical protein